MQNCHLAVLSRCALHSVPLSLHKQHILLKARDTVGVVVSALMFTQKALFSSLYALYNILSPRWLARFPCHHCRCLKDPSATNPHPTLKLPAFQWVRKQLAPAFWLSEAAWSIQRRETMSEEKQMYLLTLNIVKIKNRCVEEVRHR